ncbi:MAG: chemotaxis protein CheX, partial [Acidimicrobiales bacterium]
VWDFLGLESVARTGSDLPVGRPTIRVATSLQGETDELTLSLWCSDLAAAQLAAAMLGLPTSDLEPDDVRDALGEIANILGGNLKAFAGDRTLGFAAVSEGEIPAGAETEILCALTSYPGEQPVRVRLARSARAAGRQLTSEHHLVAGPTAGQVAPEHAIAGHRADCPTDQAMSASARS